MGQLESAKGVPMKQTEWGKRARKRRKFSGPDLEWTSTKTTNNNPWRLGSRNASETPDCVTWNGSPVMQAKTRAITALVLSGLSVLSCLALYQFADLTPANSPLPKWAISSMAKARSTGGPEGADPVGAGVAGQTAPALEPPAISQPSPDLTAMASKEAAAGVAETNGGAQLAPASPEVSSDMASPKPEQAQLAPIEADRQAAAAEREAQVEDRSQGARLQEAQRASAGFELERRAEADRLVAERRKALQAAAEATAAEQAQLAQMEADRQAAAAEKKAAAEREAQVEDRSQGARLREAQRASAGFELERRAEAEQTTTGSISTSDARSETRMASRNPDDERGQFKRLSDGRHAPKVAQPGSNVFAGLGGPAKRTRRTIAPSGDLDWNGGSRAGDGQRSASDGDDGGASSGASKTATSVVATLNEPGGPRRRILKRRCASILQNSDEYDDDLVSLCQTWSAGARAAR
jgi:hypothetical protein